MSLDLWRMHQLKWDQTYRLQSQHMLKSGKQQWVGVKRVLRYINETLDFNLHCKATNLDAVTNSLSGYADADWAGDMTTRKSTLGYMFQIGKSTVSWRSKHQSIVALSSTKTEYVALSNATQEAIWLQTLFKGIGLDQAKSLTMFEDKQGTIELAKNPSHHSRTAHIIIEFIMYVMLLLQRRFIYNTALHRKWSLIF